MFKKFLVTSLLLLPLFISSCASSEKPESILIAQEGPITLTSVKFECKIVDSSNKGVGGIEVSVKTNNYNDSDTTSSSGYFSIRSKFESYEVIHFHFFSREKGIDSFVSAGNIPKGLDPVNLRFTIDQKNQVHLSSVEF